LIEVLRAEPASVGAAAILRPVAADGSAITPAMRRLELAAGTMPADQWSNLGELPVGSAAITGGGLLPVDFLINVVVRSQDEPVTIEAIRRGLLNGLRRCSEWGIDRLAVVPLGTGAGNLDIEDAAGIMAAGLAGYMQDVDVPSQVVVTVETEYEREVFERELRRAVTSTR
jgi:O-acetyl-ADP-ribose deacetylase (regulator of RNase III)